MSVEAITWALKEPVCQSSTKFVLVVLANCANSETFEAYPSVKFISDATAQDRKTVLSNLKKLLESGHISDTGRRAGHTGQVVIYRLNSAENGTLKQSQKRNSTENGTVPNFPPNSTVFPTKESQNSHVTVPKTGHGTVIEPSIEPSLNHNKENDPSQNDLALPTWLEKNEWDGFVQFRRDKKKPMTTHAEVLMVKNLIKIAQNHSPEIALEQMHTSMRSGWDDIYPPKVGSLAPEQSSSYNRKMKTLSGLTGGILGSSDDAQFKPISESKTIDMDPLNENLLR